MIKNDSITDLHFEHVTLTESLLTELLPNLPALKYLTLSSCYFVTLVQEQGITKAICRNKIIIDLPESSFDNLVLDYSMPMSAI